MSVPQKGMLADLFDAVVHFPTDAAFGLSLPADNSGQRVVELGLAYIAAGGAFISAITPLGVIGVSLMAVVGVHVASGWAATARTARRANEAAQPTLK